MKNRRRLAAALVCIPLCAPLGGLQAEEPSPAEIQKVLRSSDSHVRHETWKRLNPENSRHFKILLQILGSLPWYDREGAVVALAKAATDETVSKMIEALEKDRNPFVRQGMADALAKMNDPKFYPHLYEALQDKNPFVRRVVVHSLRIHKKNEAVEALVQLFQKEEDEVVRSFIEHSLNDLTQAFLGPNPVRWLSWWEQAKLDPDYELGKTDEEALAKAEEFGQKLRKRKTVSILGGVTLSSSERGADEGVPILIIPPYGHSSQIMLPFLSELEKNHRLHYIELPLLSAFDKKKLTTVSDRNIPYYPTELLVKAFEDLRRGTGHEHFAIMACGMNSWIAMEYARLYPSSVAALIFVAPISSMKEYGDATMRLQSAGRSRKDDEMLFFGLGRRFNSKTGESELEQYHRDKKVPEREGEGASIDRRSWSLFFKDERDSVIGMLYPVKHHPMGSVAIPDFNLLKNDPPARPIPTIVICGEASLYTSVQDCQAIGKYYRGMTLVYKDSSCMPFAEECSRFNQNVGAFLKKYTRPAKKKDATAREPSSQATAKTPPAEDAGEAGATDAERELEAALRKKTATVRADFAQELARAAAWALRNGLPDEAKKLIEQIRQLDPSSRQLPQLEKAAASAPLPKEDEKLESERKTFAEKIRRAETAHGKRLFDFAAQCFKYGLFTRSNDLLRQVLVLTDDRDSYHRKARTALGFVWDRDEEKWISRWEAEKKKDHFLTDEGWVEKKYRRQWEQGLRPYMGKWVEAEFEKEKRSRNEYDPYTVESENFVVMTTLGRKEAWQFAQMLEGFKQKFYEVFIGYYDQQSAGDFLFRRGKDQPGHKVYVFPSRVEYLTHVKAEQGNRQLLRESAGFYLPSQTISRFFWSENLDAVLSTLFHEVAHQLFEETKDTSRGGSEGNNWLVEGLASYVETWERQGDEWYPGRNTGISYLHRAKRILADDSKFSLLSFVQVDNKTFHEMDRGDNYCLSCALTHFFMHYDDEVYREDFVRFASAYYEGKVRMFSLAEYIDVPGGGSAEDRLAILEKQFREYMAAL